MGLCTGIIYGQPILFARLLRRRNLFTDKSWRTRTSYQNTGGGWVHRLGRNQIETGESLWWGLDRRCEWRWMLVGAFAHFFMTVLRRRTGGVLLRRAGERHTFVRPYKYDSKKNHLLEHDNNSNNSINPTLSITSTNVRTKNALACMGSSGGGWYVCLWVDGWCL